MSSWVHNPQGKIIAIVREQPKHGPLKSRTSKVGGGIVLVVALAIAVGLMAFWPSDTPAVLPVSSESDFNIRLLSGVAGSIGGEDQLFALTAGGDGLQHPSLTVFTTNDSNALVQGSSLPAPVDELDDDLPAAPGIAVSEGTAFISVAGPDLRALWIVDVSDPEAPRELATIELETRPGSMAVEGDLVAVGPVNGTVIRFFDVSDPSEPQQIGTYRESVVSFIELGLMADKLYITNRRGISVVDVSSPAGAQEVSHWSSDTWDRVGPTTRTSVTPRIATAKDHLFVAADVWGVELLDASNPTDLSNTTRSLSRSQIPGSDADHAIDLAATGDTLYILWQRDFIGHDPLRWEYTIQEVDVSDPGDPQVVAETDDISGDLSLQSLAIVGDHVYFLSGDRIHAISTSE